MLETVSSWKLQNVGYFREAQSTNHEGRTCLLQIKQIEACFLVEGMVEHEFVG